MSRMLVHYLCCYWCHLIDGNHVLVVPPKITSVQVNWVMDKNYSSEICFNVSGVPNPKVQMYRYIGDGNQKDIIIHPTTTNAPRDCFPVGSLTEDNTGPIIISAMNCFETTKEEVWIRELPHGPFSDTPTSHQSEGFLTSSGKAANHQYIIRPINAYPHFEFL